MFDVIADRLLALLERASASASRAAGTFLRRVRDGRGRGAAGRRLRRAGRRSRSCCSRATCTRRGTTIALALPFCLGLGMAMPWPIAGAGIAALPKPGAWMVRVKQALRRLHPRDGGLLRLRGLRRCSRTAGSIRPRSTSSVRGEAEGGWHPSLAEGLDAGQARAEAGAHRHVGHLVQELPRRWTRRRSRDAEVDGGAGGLREDQVPGRRPRRAACEGLMQRFDAVGLPTYVILRPQQRAAAR